MILGEEIKKLLKLFALIWMRLLRLWDQFLYYGFGEMGSGKFAYT